MHKTARTWLALTLTSSGALSVACSVADIGGGRAEHEPPGAGAKAAQCSVSATPEDPAKYAACACAKGGAARCVPLDKVPAAVAAELDRCEDGACVPDSLVASGGAAPATCQSALGEGRCLDLCVPLVARYEREFGRGEGGACAEHERCVPCENPLNGESTGVCAIGKGGACSAPDASAPATDASVSCPYAGPPLRVDVYPTCADGARCVSAEIVPPKFAAMLAKCATGLCVPEKVIQAAGQHVPKTCRSVGGGEGRCASLALPSVAAGKDALPRDVCDPNERCVSCFNPVDGKETGACSTVSCDSPKEKAVVFAGCCRIAGTLHGACVPNASLPANARELLDEDTCKDGELCAPKEMLDPTHVPPPCKGDSLVLGKYDGVCVSDCVELGIGALALSQGSCKDHETCVACTQGGKPTGAPGCQQK